MAFSSLAFIAAALLAVHQEELKRSFYVATFSCPVYPSPSGACFAHSTPGHPASKPVCDVGSLDTLPRPNMLVSWC